MGTAKRTKGCLSAVRNQNTFGIPRGLLTTTERVYVILPRRGGPEVSVNQRNDLNNQTNVSLAS